MGTEGYRGVHRGTEGYRGKGTEGANNYLLFLVSGSFLHFFFIFVFLRFLHGRILLCNKPSGVLQHFP